MPARFDLHVHSEASLCGRMSMQEIVQAAKAAGLAGVAVTDHGLRAGVPAQHFEDFVRAYPAVVDGVRVLKGIELNVVTREGEVDMPMQVLDGFDWVALGLHGTEGLPTNRGPERNADALVAALTKNPWIDVVVHPTQHSYPVDFGRLLPVMAERGVAFEINECNHHYGRSSVEYTADILRDAVRRQVPIVASSDAHSVHEIGKNDCIRRILTKAGVDPGVVVNATAETLGPFVEDRRARRVYGSRITRR